MTGIERIQCAIAHRESDVIPYDPYVSPGHALHLLGYETHEMFTVPGLLPEAMIYTTKFYDSDICYCRGDQFLGGEYDTEETESEVFFVSKETKKPVYKVKRDLHNLIPIHPPEPVIVHDVSEVDKKMPVTSASEILKSKVAKNIRKYQAALGADTFLFGCMAGVTIKPLKQHRGFEQALMDLYANPQLANAIMERRFEQLHEFVLAFEELGVHGYYTGDAEASCSLVAPEMFRAMLKPHYIRHIEDIKSHGMVALLHICGKSDKILEDIRDIGPDIFESLDPPSLGGDIDLADAKRRIGDTICLKGNLDAPHLIKEGPAEKVYEACIRCCEVAAEGGGYILSTEQITPDTSEEHVLAMEEARRDFKL